MIDTIQLYSQNHRVKDLTKWTRAALSERVVENTGPEGGEVIEREKFSKEISNSKHISATIFPASNRLTFHFSAPKVLYGTSLSEVEEGDARPLIEKIERELRDGCGVEVIGGVESCLVSRIDFCKNLKVEHHPTDYLFALNKMKFSRREKATYQHETLSFRNTRRELTFYDKVQEVGQKEKDPEVRRVIRNMEHDILRMETRLRRFNVVRKDLGDVGLLHVFSKTLVRDRLCKEFDTLTSADGEQMDFNFKSNIELIEKIRRDRTRNIMGEFLEVKGLSQLLIECGYDWKIVEELLAAAVKGRSQRYTWMKKLQKKQSLAMVERDRNLIGEIREKLKKVA